MTAVSAASAPLGRRRNRHLLRRGGRSGPKHGRISRSAGWQPDCCPGRHAASPQARSGRTRLPRLQSSRSAQRPLRDVRRLSPARASADRSLRAGADAHPGLLPHAEPLAPVAVAARGRTPCGVHALGDDDACGALADGPCHGGGRGRVSGPVSGGSRAARPALARRGAVHRTQPGAGPARARGCGLALVERVSATGGSQSAPSVGLAAATAI